MDQTTANAERYFEDGVDFAERCGDRERLAMLNAAYGGVRVHAGSGDDYFTFAGKAMEIATRLDNPILLAALKMTSAYAHFSVGKINESYAIANELYDSTPADTSYGADYIGYSPRIGALIVRGWTSTLLGRFDETRSSFAEATQLLGDNSYGDMPFWMTVVTGKAAALSGVCENPRAISARSFEMAERFGTDFGHAIPIYELAMYHIAGCDWDNAIATLKQFLELDASDHSAAICKASALAHLAEASLHTDDVETAQRSAREAMAYASSSGYRWDLEPWLAQARVSMATGDRDEAKSALDEFETLIEQTGARAFLPFLHEGRAEFSSAFNSEWSRNEELEEAKRLFEESGASGHAVRIEGLLT